MTNSETIITRISFVECQLSHFVVGSEIFTPMNNS
jgi:hypothetical protein